MGWCLVCLLGSVLVGSGWVCVVISVGYGVVVRVLCV